MFCRICILMIFAGICLKDALCQVPFIKSYGGTRGNSVIQTNDGGYAVVGIAPDSGVRSDFYFIKTNVFGDAIWSKKFLTLGDDIGYNVIQTPDTGYLLAGILDANPDWGGWCWEPECFKDLGLIKIDSNGDTLWTKKWDGGSLGQDGIYDIEQTADGGFIVTGFYQQVYASPGDGYTFLVKLNSNGDTLWTQKYALYSFAYSVQQTFDKGYVIAATKAPSYPPTLADIYVIKTDSTGNAIWEKTFYGGGEGFFAVARGVLQTEDSGYVVVGYRGNNNSNTYGAYFLKLNDNGDSLWAKFYDGNSQDAVLDVKQTNDGGFVLAGRTMSYGAGNSDAWLIKTDANGDTTWTKTFGSAGYDDASSLELTSDGGYVLTGQYQSSEVWIIKTDSMGNAPPITSVNDVHQNEKPLFNIFPNPTDNHLTIEFEISSNANIQFTIFDYTGKEISRMGKNHLTKGKYQEQINIQQFSTGLYFLVANINGQLQTMKIIKM